MIDETLLAFVPLEVVGISLALYVLAVLVPKFAYRTLDGGRWGRDVEAALGLLEGSLRVGLLLAGTAFVFTACVRGHRDHMTYSRLSEALPQVVEAARQYWDGRLGLERSIGDEPDAARLEETVGTHLSGMPPGNPGVERTKRALVEDVDEAERVLEEWRAYLRDLEP